MRHTIALVALALVSGGCAASADDARSAWTSFRACAYGDDTLEFSVAMRELERMDIVSYPNTCRAHLRTIAEYADEAGHDGLARSARRIDEPDLGPEMQPAASARQLAHRALWDEIEMAELDGG